MKIKMEDLLCFRFLSEPRFVSDHAALFTQTRPGDDQEGYCAQLKIVDLNSGETVWETEEGVSLGRPLDNSQIGFWKREEKNTVFYLEEIVSRRRTSLLTTPLKVLSFEFIDEHRLVALVQVDLEKPEDQPENGAEWEISDELPFLDNARGYVSKLRRSLFLFDLENGTSHRLTDEFFDTSFYALSQDARTLVFTGKSYQDIATNRDGVFACDLSSEAITTLVEPGIYRVYAAWRIRDKYYMSASLCDRYHASQNPDFYRIEPETGRMVKIAEPDVMVRGLGICSDCRYGGGRNLLTDGDDLYFTAVTMHNNNLYRMSPDGNIVRLPLESGSVDYFDVRDGRVVFVGMRGQRLQELYTYDAQSGEKRVTEINEAFYASHAPLEPQRCDFINDAGQTVQGFVLPPVDFDPNKRYPAVLDIHGGPKTAFGAVYFHEMQCLSSAGYFVLFCNPRGSDGRGNAFGDLIERYGSIDYDDLMLFVDEALKRFPAIDPERLGVTGGSYGGYMTNWIVGHTDRFKAAVTQRGITTYLIDEGCSDGGYTFMPHMYPPSPRINFEKMWDQSPLKYSKQVKTPLLFLHSDKDFRCPLCGALMMYTAIVNNGGTARMCIFKGENHELSRSGKPYNRIRRLREMFQWFDQYLKAEEE